MGQYQASVALRKPRPAACAAPAQIYGSVLPALRTARGRALRADIMVYNFGLHNKPTRKVYGHQLAAMAAYLQLHAGWLPAMVWADTCELIPAFAWEMHGLHA